MSTVIYLSSYDFHEIEYTVDLYVAVIKSMTISKL